MNKKRNIWLLVGSVILLVALGSAFVVMQPSARDILIQTLDTSKTIDNAHAVIDVSMDTPDEKASATVEVWGRHDENGPGAFRLEVLETDKEEAVGAVVVSDGETVWAYSPVQGKVFVGTIEEAKAALKEKQPLHDEFDKEEFDHPENSEEAVDKLLEYFEANRTGSETVAGADAYQLELKPLRRTPRREFPARCSVSFE